MKKTSLTLAIIILLAASQFNMAQVARNSWSFGFGFTFPRFASTDVRPQEGNYGVFLSLQRNFTENVGLRFLGNYSYMEGRIPGYRTTTNRYYYTNGTTVPSGKEFMHSTVISGNLDLIYYFAPCLSVSPYAGLGIGAASMDPQWPSNVVNSEAKSKASAHINFIVGSEWKVTDNLNLKTEFGLHSVDGQLDGVINNNRQGFWGSNADGYITMNVGVLYYFSKGAPSKFCDLYEGIKVEAPKVDFPTLEQIEELIVKHIPQTIEKQVVVEKEVSKTKGNWVLFGVNFDFNKYSLRPESYPILEHAADILRSNQSLKVEIQGYTDNIGSENYNQNLSLQRANIVKDYLVKRGINASRLKTVGFGEADPIGDNNTPIGRAKNRRIEFKILNK